VYEIKTQYDSFDRLVNQLKNYKKFFEYINIVTVESKVKELENLIDDSVGIIVLTSKYTLRNIRKATSNIENIEQDILFDVLKKDEYLIIIKQQHGYVPDVPNTQIFSECKKMFIQFDKSTAHKEVLKALKERKSHKKLNENIQKFPNALRVEILNSNFDEKKQEKILSFLNKPLKELFEKKESNVLSVS
jgi:ribosomal protein L17